MNKRIWFITGVSNGLGKALAETVMKKGDFVIGTMRNKEDVLKFNENNEDRGEAYYLDVIDEDQIMVFCNHLISKYKKFDVLVNNAGIGFGGAIEEASISELKNIFQVNFYSVFLITKAFLPLFRKQGFGHIFQISSHGGVKAFAGFGIYNASKFALEAISEALASETAPLGITVTIVEPGPFRTQFAGKNFVTAQKTIAEYNDTSGAFKNKIKQIDGKQEGNPLFAAEEIFKYSNKKNPPLRLPLGKISLNTIQAKIDSLQSDINSNRSIAESTVFIN